MCPQKEHPGSCAQRQKPQDLQGKSSEGMLPHSGVGEAGTMAEVEQGSNRHLKYIEELLIDLQRSGEKGGRKCHLVSNPGNCGGSSGRRRSFPERKTRGRR